MHENGKMRPAETVPGIGEEGIKENDRLWLKNFCKCHNVLPTKQQKSENFKKVTILEQS
jgi:hypothetical protein